MEVLVWAESALLLFLGVRWMLDRDDYARTVRIAIDAESALREGRPREAIRAAARLRSARSPRMRATSPLILLRIRSSAGESSRAANRARRILEAMRRDHCDFRLLNTLVDALISAGRYREALAIPDRFMAAARERGRIEDPGSHALLRINLAEALYESGEEEAALEQLSSVEAAGATSPLAASGLSCLRAWIRIHRGEVAAARADLDAVDPAGLGEFYEAELHMTRAALEREAGDPGQALVHARKGLETARRPSSERNALFLLADLAARRGETEEARETFRRAVDHRYRGQGGDGLLRYASFLESSGDAAGALAALRLCVERDPEGARAREAAARLRARAT